VQVEGASAGNTRLPVADHRPDVQQDLQPPDPSGTNKHVIEPTLAFQRTTAIDNFADRQLETDFVVGSVTRVTYEPTGSVKERRRAKY
jgi:hypothetical protein